MLKIEPKMFNPMYVLRQAEKEKYQISLSITRKEEKKKERSIVIYK